MRKLLTIFLCAYLFLIAGIPWSMAEGSTNQTGVNQGGENVVFTKKYSLAELQTDFTIVKTIIEKYHPKLYTDQQELNRLFINQAELLKDNMSELDFYRVVTPVIAKLNCGHTMINLSSESQNLLMSNGTFLPLSIRIINNKALVLRNLSSMDMPVGSEILAINGRTIPQIIKILTNNLSSDGTNISRKLYWMNREFNLLYYYFVDNSDMFSITYQNPTARQSSQVTVTAVTLVKFITSVTNQPNNGPYYTNFEKDYAVLTIKSFSFYEEYTRNKFKEFIDDFFAQVANQKIANLILDLRDNGGGDPYCSSHVFSYLINKPYPYFAKNTPGHNDLESPIAPAKNKFNGSLYILINGGCFSATGHLCSLLKYHQIGTFIGDETGGSFVCTDGSRNIVLKNTRLRLRYSTQAFQTAVSGLTPGRGIIPDYYVFPSIQDYLNRNDVEKDYAIKLIQDGSKGEL